MVKLPGYTTDQLRADAERQHRSGRISKGQLHTIRNFLASVDIEGVTELPVSAWHGGPFHNSQP